MNGVYLLYSDAGSDAQRQQQQQHGSSAPNSPSVNNDTPQEPSVIVLTQPQRSLASLAASSQPSSSPSSSLRVCDVELLQLLYLAFPSSFFLLLSPSATLATNLGTDVECPDAYGECSSNDDAHRRAQEQTNTFFDSVLVQQRTCRLTLGTEGTTVFLNGYGETLPQQRHSLQLSPRYAARIMLRQPWLKDLHECPHTLCYAAQVAATLLLHATSTTFFLSTGAALEVVSQCASLGDTCTAAAVLACVSQNVSAQVLGTQPCMTGLSTAAEARHEAPPLMPLWIRGCAFSGNADDDAAAMPPSGTPLLSTNNRSDGAIVPELNVEGAYCTYTSETLSCAGTHPVPPVNVLGGSISIGGLGVTPVQAPPSLTNTGATGSATASGADATNQAPRFQEILHVLVCTALGGAVSERAEDVVRPLPDHLLPPLLQLLHADIVSSPASSASSESDGNVQLQLHISVNGYDVLAGHPPQYPSDMSGPNSRYDGDTLQGTPSSGPSAALIGCSVAEAYARCSIATLNQLTTHDEEVDAQVVSYMFHQCEATLREVQQEAHRNRLMWVRHQAMRGRKHTNDDVASADVSLPSTRAAIVLCADEYHLAQWAESGHPFASSCFLRCDDDSREEGLSPHWAPYAGVPIYICLIPSSAVSPPRLLSRLCDAPSIVRGVWAAQQLCTRTHGFFFIGSDSDASPHDTTDDNGVGKGRAAAESSTAWVVRCCDTVMAAVVAHLHAWLFAVYRDVHWCVFSEVFVNATANSGKRPHESERRRSRLGESGRASSRRILSSPADHLPHCEVCAPAVVATARNTTAHVQLWRCTEALLAPAAPVAPFLAYEVIPSTQKSSSRSGRTTQRNSDAGLTTCAAPQPWVEELVAQYAFAFAHARCGGGDGVVCAVSRVVRVQPRLALFKPGPLQQWCSRQLHLHHASVILAAVLEAQVERVKEMLLVLAATEGGRNVRRGVVSADEREAQAEEVIKALQRLAIRVTRLKEEEQALLTTLRHLLPFESLNDRRTVSLPAASPTASPLMDVLREVEAARHTQLREQQRKEYQLGEPLAPSPTDSCAAVARLLSLIFLRARMMEVHARYAACGGDHLVQRTTEVLARKQAGAVGDAGQLRDMPQGPPTLAAAAAAADTAGMRASLQTENKEFDIRARANELRQRPLDAVQQHPSPLSVQLDTTQHGDTSPLPPPQQQQQREKQHTSSRTFLKRTSLLSQELSGEIVRETTVEPSPDHALTAPEDPPCSAAVPAAPLSLSSPSTQNLNVRIDAGSSPGTETQRIAGPASLLCKTETQAPAAAAAAAQGGVTQRLERRNEYNVVLLPQRAYTKSVVATPAYPSRERPPGVSLLCTPSSSAVPREGVTCGNTFIRLRDYNDDDGAWLHATVVDEPFDVCLPSASEAHRNARAAAEYDVQQPLRMTVSTVPEVYHSAIPSTGTQQNVVFPPSKSHDLESETRRIAEDQDEAEPLVCHQSKEGKNRRAGCYGNTPAAASQNNITDDGRSHYEVEIPFSQLSGASAVHAEAGASPEAAQLAALASTPNAVSFQQQPREKREPRTSTNADLKMCDAALGAEVQSPAMPLPLRRPTPPLTPLDISGNVGHRCGSDAAGQVMKRSKSKEVAADTSVLSDKAAVTSAAPSSASGIASTIHTRTGSAAGGEGEAEPVTETPAPHSPDTPVATSLLQATTPTSLPSGDEHSGVTRNHAKEALQQQRPSLASKQASSRKSTRHSPPLPRDMRWFEEPRCTADGRERYTSLAALLTSRLPPLVTPRTTALHVARYASGVLTISVSDPTAACAAAVGTTDTSEQPAAHLALLVMDDDTATGTLRLLESLACAIAPGADRMSSGGAPHETTCAVAEKDLRSHYTFQSRLPPGTAVAVVYVGLRRSLHRGVILADVLWLSGIAFSVESPSVRQVRVTSVQSDALELEWHSAASHSPAAVKVLVTELATPPAGALAFTENKSAVSRDAEAAAAQSRNSIVQVGQRSPMVIAGLRCASIYHVQLIPVPAVRRVATVNPQQFLECVVDADVSACAVMAATSVAPTLDFMRVRKVIAVSSSFVLDGDGVYDEQRGGDHPATADSSLHPLCSSVTGTVVSPLLHYRTSVFPASVLRHFSFLDEEDMIGDGGAAAHQLIRLHFTLVPIIGKDSGDVAASGNALSNRSDTEGFLITSSNGAGNAEDPRGGGGSGSGSFGVGHHARRGDTTCSHVFTMRAGEEVGVALSLCVQLDVELVKLRGPLAPHYISVLAVLQRGVLRAVLGPFHVCGPAVELRDVGTSTAELAWEGSCPLFDVSVVCWQTATSALVKRPAVSEATEASEGTTATAVVLTAHGGAAAAQVYRVTGVPVNTHPPPHYRATLRLADLHLASAYSVKVRCATNHVGDALQRVWHTCPAPPPSNVLCAVFDSATRHLRLRFVQQHRGAKDASITAAKESYQITVEPLGTSIDVPVFAAESGDGSVGVGRSVERVVDCGVVKEGTPIRMQLRHCVVWHDAVAGNDNDARSSTAATTMSKAVTYCVVSDLKVNPLPLSQLTAPLTSTAQAEREEGESMSHASADHPVMELTWTCGDAEGRQPVTYVEFNGSYRVKVDGGEHSHLQLTLPQLKAAGAMTKGATTSTCDEAGRSTADCRSATQPCTWNGLLYITGFGVDDAVPHGSPSCYVVPDRCQPIILPPPPGLPRSAICFQNYEDEAVVDVDVHEIYRRYADLLVNAARQSSRVSSPAHPSCHLADVLRQRLRLTLEVHNGGSAVLRYPLLPPKLQQQQQKRHYQRVRIPLPCYRPYDGHLALRLHACMSDAPVVSSNGSARVEPYTFFCPIPTSPAALVAPIPPAEPIIDITASAITTRDAVLSWTPPLSLLRHLRQQPNMRVAYEVRLYPASAISESLPSTTTHAAAAPCRVWLSAEPHLVITGLQPATPYAAQVRGTGFGDYYATVRFVTAPMVDSAMVEQLRRSLTVETVVRGTGCSEAWAERREDDRQNRRSPALWGVLPASTVVTWTLTDHADLCTAEAPSRPTTTTLATTATVAVEVATHYTASLVAANGELLRRWTSSPATTTTLYHEWTNAARSDVDDDASGEHASWPHLELMAQAQVSVRCPPSPRIEGQARESPSTFAMPHPRQSGPYCRTRLDLIGMPRLVEPPVGEACAVAWEGSSPCGYDISWCLSSAVDDVQHATVPATSRLPYTFSIPSAVITAALAKHRSSDVSAKAEERIQGPVSVLMWISTGAPERSRGRKARGRRAVCSANPASNDMPPHGSYVLSGILGGGSNVLCMAWLLSPHLIEAAHAEAVVVHRTATNVTLLLPPNYPPSAVEGSADKGKEAQDIASLLQRRWSLVACPAPANTAAANDVVAIHPWTTERCAEAALTVFASASVSTALRNGMAVVDVEMPSQATFPHRTLVELRCVDAVVDKQAGVWQELVQHLMEAHAAHFCAATSSPERSGVLPPLRWLQSLVEASCEQHLPSVCALTQLRIAAIEEAGVVGIPPLIDAVRCACASGVASIGERDGATQPNHRRAQSWLPLQTADAATEKHAQNADEEPLCRLSLFVGERQYGEEDSDKSPCGVKPNSVKESTAASAAQATLAELEALQALSQRGHPTLRARLTWVSNDEAFVIRIAGPYEALQRPAMNVKERVAQRQQEGEGATQPTSTSSNSVSDPLQQRCCLHRIFSLDAFPSVDEMPRQRTYTCISTAAPGGASAGQHHSDAYLSLQPDGSVTPMRAEAVVGARATTADPCGMALAHACTRYVVDVDGLLPEAFYRVQVTGVNSGDTALRLQFITPPSYLTQIVTVGEGVEGREGVGLPPLRTARLHARVYNPHIYSAPQRRGTFLAPGLSYVSYAALEVCSVASAQCLRSHLTYDSRTTEERRAGSSVEIAAVRGADDDDVNNGDVCTTAESSFNMEVEEAVQVYAVRHLDVAVVASSATVAESFATFSQQHTWGQVLIPSTALSMPSPGLGEMLAWTPLQQQASMCVRLPLCCIPPLPRVKSLTVQRRTPHSLQLSWRWYSMHSRPDVARSPAKPPAALFCVRCCRVSAGVPRNEEKGATSRLTDGCTVVVPVTSNPLVTLAPLQPGALYAISIREILHAQAAGARAVHASPSIDSLFMLSPSSIPTSRPRPQETDLYAVRVLPVPAAAAAAIRALARVSARPASLVLTVAQQQDRNSSSVRVPRGAALCYALTPPRPPTWPQPLAQSVRRRPGSLAVVLPSSCAHTQLREVAPHVEGDGTLRVLSFVAAVVVPENVVYIPRDAADAMQAWWETTHAQDSDAASTETNVWSWYADRLRATMEHDWLPQSTGAVGQHRLRGRAGEATVQEHWNHELVRWLVRRSGAVDDKENVSGLPTSWRLQVRPMAVRHGDGDGVHNDAAASAPLTFVLPVKEPAPVDVAAAPQPTRQTRSAGASRAVYLVQCVEVLPPRGPASVGIGSCGVVGRTQQLTVCHAPLTISKLQLVRDVGVRGSTTLHDTTSAELRVQWTWATWAWPSPTRKAQRHRRKDATTAAQTQPPPAPCSARVTCTPLPATAAAVSAGPSLLPTAGAVFVQHVEEGQREVIITGLSPATLYRLVLDNVRLGKSTAAISCADKAITALTPPAPPEQGELPQLHYRVLPSTASTASTTTTTAPSRGGATTTEPHADPPSSPAGIEVHFDLPAARPTSQGLLLCPYAVLVNLDAVDIAACCTAADCLAATAAERIAPHVQFLPRGKRTSAVGGKTVLGEAAEREAPLVYHNTAVRQRLRLCVTLRQPLQQRYALVFFNAVVLGWRQQENVTGSSSEEETKYPPKPTNGVATAAPADLSCVEKVMYSVPVVKAMRYPSSVRSAYTTGTATSTPADPHGAALHRWRRLLCRPTRLIVQQRTPTCLTLRWQLDLSVARLCGMERLRLLRYGVFSVRITPDEHVAQAVHPRSATPDGSMSGGRIVFYRANASSSATPSPPTSAHAPERKPIDKRQPEEETTASLAEVLQLAVCDYLTPTNDTEADGAEAVEAAGSTDVLLGSSTSSTSALAAEGQDGDGDNVAAARSPHACLTYELAYPCRTYAAAHTGYTIEVDLAPDWNRTGGAAGSERSTSPPRTVPVKLTAVTITVPPVLPPQPVQRVSVVHVTQTSCMIQWDVAEGERPAAYCVHYTQHEVRCGCGAPNCVLKAEEKHQLWVRNPSQTSVTLEHLQPHTSYTVCVVPCNIYGEPCEDEGNAMVTVHTY
jgi:hypothetical protein